ncbi:uncharacterized protein LOC108825135 [Raphanus sativus]|uniref:Uncharacterized protein LOC108825135 n=1 Tax=Raphanus sativus TaxID=3726 RepID=A0A9W3CH46_RAPSA|nr:uncharacterized protein LOC108825135 [Raphanus sativus]
MYLIRFLSSSTRWVLKLTAQTPYGLPRLYHSPPNWHSPNRHAKPALAKPALAKPAFAKPALAKPARQTGTHSHYYTSSWIRKDEEGEDSVPFEASGSKRPPGVKAAKAAKAAQAAKASGKKHVVHEIVDVDKYESMWTIKQQDLAAKERLSKTHMLENLLARQDALADYEEVLKKKLISGKYIKFLSFCFIRQVHERMKSRHVVHKTSSRDILMEGWRDGGSTSSRDMEGVQRWSRRRRRRRTRSGKKTKKKRVVIERNREEGHQRLWNDYFSDTPTYQENQFRRRFRINKSLFMRIVDRLSNEVPYFRQTQDVTGRSGLSTLQKCTAAIRVLAYGSAFDAVDEYIRLAASTARLCVENFVEAIIDLFGDQYLRRPTQDDLQRLLHFGEVCGFPGMIGIIDCMHWEWKNCPTSWKGQFSRTLNDINILDRSPVFDDIIHGQAPQVNFSVNGNPYSMAYYLTDGIYPKWATFIQSIPLPQGRKAVLFAKTQEAVRKDVERAFGVLQARFAIVKNPARCWDILKIGKIMRACIILHNMIVENERVDRTQYATLGFQPGEDGESSSADQTFFIDTPPSISNQDSVIISMRDKPAHQRLKRDLVEHIWRRFERDQRNN